MKASAIRDMSVDELGDKLLQLKKEQFNLRFQAASGQLEKTDQVSKIKRDIARVKTILGEKVKAS